LNNLTPQEGQKTDKESMQKAQDKTLAAIGEDLFAIAVDQPFRFPATFTFVFRAFTTLEGTLVARGRSFRV
jgi:predicted unusual protein kinase regulating ubiquinone biosynthesis (AarF/ABC1/UbiB family)